MIWTRRTTPFESAQDEERFGIVQIVLLVLYLLLIAGLFFGLSTLFKTIDPLLFLGASLALVMALSMTVRLEWGVLIWMAVGPAVTIRVVTIAGGTTGGGLYPSMLILSLLLGAWFTRMLLDQEFRIPSTSINLPFVMLCLWTVICVFAGNVFWEPFVRTTHKILLVQIFCSGMFFLALGTVWLVGQNLSSEKMLRYYFNAILFISVWSGVIRLTGLGKWSVIVYDPLLRAHGGAIATAFYFVARKGRVKTLMAFIALFCVSSVFMEFLGVGGGQWLSGWLALCVPVAVVIFMRSKQTFITLSVIAVMFMIAMAPYVSNVFDHAEGEGDYKRFETWARSFRMAWRHNLIFGVGPGNFWDYHDSYFGANMQDGLTSAHGQYQQIVAETGWVGLGLTAWLIVAIYRYMFRVRKRAKDPVLNSIVTGAIGSVTGVLLASLFGDYLFPTYHNAGYQSFSTTISFWVVVGGVVAVDQYLRRQGEQGKT